MTDESNPQGFTIRDRRGQTEPAETTPAEPSPTHESAAPTESTQGTGAQVSGSHDASGHHLNEVTFTTFILSLSTSAVVSLGEIPDPTTGRVESNWAHAKQIIDILGIIKDKTKGNLQKEEETLLNGLLYDLRLKYLQKTNQIKL